MQYSKLWQACTIFILVFFLNACESPGLKKEKQKKADEISSEQAATEGEASATGFVVLPNPYQPGEVPGQARKEHQKIVSLMAAKKWKEAEGALQIMTTTFPQLSGPYINLGIVYMNLNQPDEAEKALQFAINTNPQNLDAYTQLGVLYREQGKFNEAEQTYLAALKIWPHHLPSTLNLGILYDLYMGRFDEALKYYELSQNILGGEDRQLKGWIADLSRRIESQ